MHMLDKVLSFSKLLFLCCLPCILGKADICYCNVFIFWLCKCVCLGMIPPKLNIVWDPQFYVVVIVQLRIGIGDRHL